MATPTTNLTMQNWFETTLSSSISGSDTAIPLNNLPTGVEGFLIIEPDSSTNREVIFYTSKTASQVNCSSAADGRGQDGTSAIAHSAGATVRMNFTTGHYTALKNLFTTTPQGWTNLGIAQSGTIVHNGNRSYTVPFASDVSGLLTPGMRLLFNKTVAGNAYMGGAFNGTSQYFTKTSPSGTLGTVANNFTLEAVLQPTAYQVSRPFGRADAAANNSIEVNLLSTGQVRVVVRNGGAGNYRYVDTYQSLPLNKKTHVAVSWTSGTVVIYFDGVSIPVTAAVTGGTAPTTAGTGGDWSIGRCGAYAAEYFPGYISNVAVFDAVLSASTIKQHATYKLTGSETNCIGAWSLDNTAVNQQAPGTNDLTAQGSVGYTAMSPHGQLGNGVEASKAVALVMAVNGSTVTVQTPEGVTIPTTGGISAVSYAASGVPFGWVVDEARWMITSIYRITSQQTSPAAGVWYNPSSRKLNIPAGTWKYIGHTGSVSGTSASGNAPYVSCSMGTSPSTSGIAELNHLYGISIANIYIKTGFYRKTTNSITLAAATDYYENVSMETSLCVSVEALSCDLFALPAGI